MGAVMEVISKASSDGWGGVGVKLPDSILENESSSEGD
jgi:hypothetical protein